MQCHGFRAHDHGILFLESRTNGGKVSELASSDRHIVKIWTRSSSVDGGSGKAQPT